LKRLDTTFSGIDELQLTPKQWKNLEKLWIHGSLPDFNQCVNLKDFGFYKNGMSVDPSGNVHGTEDMIILPILSRSLNYPEVTDKNKPC
jgi:hypothetical protein